MLPALLLSLTSLVACAPSSGPPPAAADAPHRPSGASPGGAGPRHPGPAFVALDDAGPQMQQASLRALLYNLIDDGDPARFNDPQWPVVCGERSTVALEGRPLAGGERVPDGDFTLEFSLDGACPLGDGGPLLFGRLHMLVVRDDVDGLVPVTLMPR